MKKTLEYKILKHLSKNDNGEYLDISFLTENKSLLKTKINDLNKQDLINIELSIDPDSKSDDLNDLMFISNCRINLNGYKYLRSLNEKSIILKLKILTIILSAIIGGSTIYFSRENSELKENRTFLTKENDSLKVENVRILKLVDSLIIDNNLHLDKLNSKKVEMVESTKAD